MTFSTEETSVQDGRPIKLLTVTLDGVTPYRWTNSDRSQVFGIDTWTPAPWLHTQHRVNADQPGSQLEIKMPTTHEATKDLAQAWITRPPESRSTAVTIHKHHQDDVDNEFQLEWIGSMVSAGYEEDGTVTVFLCRSLDNMFTLQGPRKNWGTQCNHELYDSECQLSEAAFTRSADVIAVAGDGVTFTLDNVPEPTVSYVGGEFRTLGGVDSRLIVGRTGDDIKVQYPVPSIVVGSTVEFIEGCDHTMTHCALFPNGVEPSGTNIENYGGSPYTPVINPFEKGLEAI